MLTTVAEDLFAQNQFDLALRWARPLLLNSRRLIRSLARTAWTVIAHSQFDLQNYSRGRGFLLPAAPFTPVDDTAASRRSRTESHPRSTNRARLLATPAFSTPRLAFHAPGPGRTGLRYSATAEYDAARRLIQMQAWGQATSVLEGFRRDHPDSEFADDITAKLAVSYQESGRAGDAAGEFERIAAADRRSRTFAAKRSGKPRSCTKMAARRERTARSAGHRRALSRIRLSNRSKRVSGSSSLPTHATTSRAAADSA